MITKTNVTIEEKLLLEDNMVFADFMRNGKLNNKILENFSIARNSAMNIVDAEIEDFEWNKVNIPASTFKNVTFKHGIIFKSFIEDASFDNVTFINVYFYDIEFNKSSFKNILFIGCALQNVKMWNLQEAKFNFINSIVDDMGIANVQINAKFTNCNIKKLGSLHPKKNSEVIIENGTHANIEVSNGELEFLKIINVENVEAIIDTISKKISIQCKNLTFHSSGMLEHVMLDAQKSERIFFIGAEIQHVNLQNIKDYNDIFFMNSKIGNIDFNNSRINEYRVSHSSIHFINLQNLIINKFSLNQAKISIMRMEQLKIFYECLLEEVVIGKLTVNGNKILRKNYEQSKESIALELLHYSNKAGEPQEYKNVVGAQLLDLME